MRRKIITCASSERDAAHLGEHLNMKHLLSLILLLTAMSALGGSRIRNLGSQKCVDGNRSPGSYGNVYESNCHSGANQKWLFERVREDAYQIVNEDSGWCLDIDPNNTNAKEHPCIGVNNQLFELKSHSQGVAIVSKWQNRCLDARRHTDSKFAYGNIVATSCHYNSNQKWVIESPPALTSAPKKPEPQTQKPAPADTLKASGGDPYLWPKGEGVCQGRWSYKKLGFCETSPNYNQKRYVFDKYAKMYKRCQDKNTHFFPYSEWDEGFTHITKNGPSSSTKKPKCPVKSDPRHDRVIKNTKNDYVYIQKDCTKRDHFNRCIEYKYEFRQTCTYTEYGHKSSVRPECGVQNDYSKPQFKHDGFWSYVGYSEKCGIEQRSLMEGQNIKEIIKRDDTMRGSLSCSSGDNLSSSNLTEKIGLMNSHMSKWAVEAPHSGKTKEYRLFLSRFFKEKVGQIDQNLVGATLDAITKNAGGAVCESGQIEVLKNLVGSYDVLKPSAQVLDRVRGALLDSSCQDEHREEISLVLKVAAMSAFERVTWDSEGAARVGAFLDAYWELTAKNEALEKVAYSHWLSIEKAFKKSLAKWTLSRQQNLESSYLMGTWQDLLRAAQNLKNPYVVAAFLEPLMDSWQFEFDWRIKLLDAACQLGSCAQNSRVFQYVTALASSATSIEDNLPAEHASVISSFQEIRSRVFLEYGITEPLEVSYENVPLPAAKLVSFMQEMSALSQNKKITGLYIGERGIDLHTSLLPDSRSVISNKILEFERKLAAKVSSLDVDVSNRIRSFQEVLNEQKKYEGLEIDRQLIADELYLLLEKLIALQDQYEEKRSENKEFLDEVSNLVANIEDSAPTIVLSDNFDIEARGGLDVDSLESPLSSISQIENAEAKKIVLSQGDILEWRANGKWSPLCAIEKAYPSLMVEDFTAEFGPRGFIVSKSQESGKIESYVNSKSIRDSSGSRQSLTNDQGFGFQKFGLTSNLTNRISTYQGREFSQESSFIKRTFNQEVSHASVAGGHRLPGTPFLDYPAGSLLMVLLPKDDDKLKNARIEVVGEVMSFVSPIDADVYLVVNDCISDSSGGRIGFSYSVKRDQSQQKGRLLWHMAKAKKEIEDKFEEVLKSEENIVSWQQTLRAKLFLDLAAEADDGVSVYDEKIKAAFDSFISRAFSQLDLLLQMKILKRNIKRKRLVLARYSDDIRDSLVIKESLENLHFKYAKKIHYGEIIAVSKDALDYLVTYALPFLLQENKKSYHREYTIEEINALLFGSSPSELASVVESLLYDFKNALDTQPDETLKTGSKIVSLAFPRPNLEQSNWNVPVADELRAKLLWDQVFKGEESSIKIGPNDLYAAATQQSLGCQYSSVVINNISVVFGVNETVLGSLEEGNGTARMSFHMGSKLWFPVGEDLYAFNIKDQYRPQESKIYFVDRMIPTFTPAAISHDVNNAGRGLSPFTEYRFSGGVDFLKDIIRDGFDKDGYPAYVDFIKLDFNVTYYKDDNQRKPFAVNCGD